MDNSTLQKDFLKLIEEALDKLDIDRLPELLSKPYKYSIVSGGKRIRPLLAVLASGLCNGEPEKAIPAALAVEILHNFTLVHDDIMDAADTRRGKPSVFKKWNESVAILSGDVMFADAYKQLDFYANSDDYSKSEYANINNTFINATIIVCEGQALDMQFVDQSDVLVSDYIKMIEGKTSALIAASLKMGAIAANASTEQQNTLYEMGYEIGKAFQIQDDLLDITADPKKFGKQPGGDIKEGKKTYLSLLAIERANKSQKEFIFNTLNNPDISQNDIENMLQLYRDLEVITDTENIITKHYDNAFTLLNTFKDSAYKSELYNLFIFLKNRDY